MFASQKHYNHTNSIHVYIYYIIELGFYNGPFLIKFCITYIQRKIHKIWKIILYSVLYRRHRTHQKYANNCLLLWRSLKRNANIAESLTHTMSCPWVQSKQNNKNFNPTNSLLSFLITNLHIVQRFFQICKLRY